MIDSSDLTPELIKELDKLLMSDLTPSRNEKNHEMKAVIATHPARTTFWRLPGAIAQHQRGLPRFLPASLVFLVVATGLFAVPPVWAETAPVTVLAAGDIAPKRANGVYSLRGLGLALELSPPMSALPLTADQFQRCS